MKFLTKNLAFKWNLLIYFIFLFYKRISITGAASLAMEEDKNDTDEHFDKKEFISPTPEIEGFTKEENTGEYPDEKSNSAKEEKENVFEKKPILMVNVENVVDESYTQDQELKVSFIIFFLLRTLLFT